MKQGNQKFMANPIRNGLFFWDSHTFSEINFRYTLRSVCIECQVSIALNFGSAYKDRYTDIQTNIKDPPCLCHRDFKKDFADKIIKMGMFKRHKNLKVLN